MVGVLEWANGIYGNNLSAFDSLELSNFFHDHVILRYN